MWAWLVEHASSQALGSTGRVLRPILQLGGLSVDLQLVWRSVDLQLAWRSVDLQLGCFSVDFLGQQIV